MSRVLSIHTASMIGAVAALGGAAWSIHTVSAAAAASAASVQEQPAAKRLIGTGSRLLSPGIMIGNTLYLSGQLGTAGRAEGVGGETKAAIANAKNILTQAQMDLSDVVSVTAYLVDVADYQAFNTAYTELFATEPRPTRTTVIVKELVQGAKIELTMTAVKAR